MPVTVGGNIKVKSNTSGAVGSQTASNVFLRTTAKATYSPIVKISTVTPLTSTASIGISSDTTPPVTVSGTCANSAASHFKMDNSNTKIVYENGVLKLAVNDNGSSSGGGSAKDYTVTVENTKNGTVQSDKKSAAADSTVTLTVTPDKGFTLETLTVLTQSDKTVKVKDLGKNKYSFTMPKSNVRVSATFAEDNTMLNFFTDVKATDYFYDAVLWAAEGGITTGTDAVHFSPYVPVSRSQVVTFLWRAAGCPAPAGNVGRFTDVSEGKYYSEAVAWAVERNITKGISETAFNPYEVCTRAQIVTFLARFAGVEDTDTESVLTDVQPTDYFAAAVKWAKDNAVTEGTTPTTFSPHENCTRAQVVTFLYRWMGK